MIRILIFCFVFDMFILPPLIAQAETSVNTPVKKRIRRRRKKRRLKVEKEKVKVEEPIEEEATYREREFPKFTYDFGVSVGSYASNSYTEANLGLNTHFSNWLIFRNSLFGRFPSKTDNQYGLDSSLRGVFERRMSLAGITLFAGPGYRLVTQGSSAFFAEAGLVLRSKVLTIGGGAKVLQIDSPSVGEPKTDTVYFLILSGAGSF